MEEAKQKEEEKLEAVWSAEGERLVQEVEAEKETWERRGLEAGNRPAPPLEEVEERGVRGEEGASERERRMKQEMEGQTLVQEFLALEESQEEELEGTRRRLNL